MLAFVKMDISMTVFMFNASLVLNNALNVSTIKINVLNAVLVEKVFQIVSAQLVLLKMILLEPVRNVTIHVLLAVRITLTV